MNPTTMYLSCLVVIIGSLVMPACAQSDKKTEQTKLLKIYRGPDVHQALLARHYPELMEYYGKYKDQITLTAKNRAIVDEAWRKYKADLDHVVEGVGRQGMWWILIPAVAEIILEQTGLVTTEKPY